MLYKLNKEQRELLQGLPETGMGSQHVDLYFKNGSLLKDVSVFNCEDLSTDENIDINTIEKIELTNSLGPNKR